MTYNHQVLFILVFYYLHWGWIYVRGRDAQPHSAYARCEWARASQALPARTRRRARAPYTTNLRHLTASHSLIIISCLCTIVISTDSSINYHLHGFTEIFKCCINKVSRWRRVNITRGCNVRPLWPSSVGVVASPSRPVGPANHSGTYVK